MSSHSQWRISTRQLWIWANGVHSSHRFIIYAKVIFKLNALKFLAHFYVFTLWGGGRGGHLQLAAALMWNSEDNVQKQAFSFPHRGLRSWAGRQAWWKGLTCCVLSPIFKWDVLIMLSWCYFIKISSRRDFFPLSYYLTRIATKL